MDIHVTMFNLCQFC